MRKDLLLEIGTEEIPAHAMPGILEELRENAEKALGELRLSYKEIRTLGTPRRMALCVNGLEERQADVSAERRGPSVQAAFDADGNPTKACQGFARGQKIDPKDLVQKDGYVYAVVHQEGQETAKLMEKMLPELIAGLAFPNNMRWRDLEFKFIRPLRWIVALYGDDVISFEVAEVKSGRTSRGHRFLGDGAFDIAAAADYETACEKQFVIADPVRRQSLIRAQLELVASENGGSVEISPNLLEEVNYLVEYPTALCGRFEEKYLALPPEAVITPMRDHQRYFPVKSEDGKLLPLFITVRNGGAEYLDTVRRGNERVLRARLADAQFFFDEDRKKTLEEHLEKTKTVVFQEGLGTIFDKSGRLEELSSLIADKMGASREEKEHAVRAAKLAKADLVTGMVTEFTELQGGMGRAYALLDGENEEVAKAIDEHYMPRFAGDSDPQTTAGRIVSLADKIDNIVATFSRGLIPTGSQDPFALRRQALGLVHMLIRAGISLKLSDIVEKSMDQFRIEGEAREKMQQDVADFIRLRLKNVFEEEGIRYDIADAVLKDTDDVYSVERRAAAVQKELSENDLAPVIQAFVRAENLAEKAKESRIDETVFKEDAERALWKAFTSAESAVESLVADHDYTGAIDALKDLADPINGFFDAVMVMDEDENVRRNRLGLLKSVSDLISRVADFRKIVLEK